MERPETMIEMLTCETQLQVVEHLAHHAVSLLHRARATLETVKSLARERSLPWSVDEAVRELDPEEVEAVKSACEDLIEEIREVLRGAEADGSDEPEGDEPEGDDIVVEVEPHFDEGRPVPCAS